MPQYEIRVTEEKTGLIIIDDEPSLEAAYERAKTMKVWAHTYDVAYKTTIQCTAIEEATRQSLETTT